MNFPGFTAEMALPPTLNSYERASAQGVPSSGIIRPASLIDLHRAICWCAEEGTETVDVGGGMEWPLEACLRWDCVVVPFVVDV